MKSVASTSGDSAWQEEVRQQVSRNFSVTRISFPYVQHQRRPAFLALYALLATVQECIYRASDFQVSRAKLSWWLEEILAAKQGRGTHPLSLQLASCGALDAWPEGLLGRLFGQALGRVDAQALGSEKELREICIDLGLLHLELECRLQQQAIPDRAALAGYAAVNGQLQLLRESLWAQKPDYLWVPLEMCARLNLQRKEIAGNAATSEDRRWINRVAGLALHESGPEGANHAAVAALPSQWSSANRHWVVFSALQRRQLSRIEQLSDQPGTLGEIARALSQVKLMDGWEAWRLAIRTGGVKPR